jgi:hypothetical protein
MLLLMQRYAKISQNGFFFGPDCYARDERFDTWGIRSRDIESLSFDKLCRFDYGFNARKDRCRASESSHS